MASQDTSNHARIVFVQERFQVHAKLFLQAFLDACPDRVKHLLGYVPRRLFSTLIAYARRAFPGNVARKNTAWSGVIPCIHLVLSYPGVQYFPG